MNRLFNIAVIVSLGAIVVAGCTSASGAPSLDPVQSNCKSYCNQKYECVDKGSDIQACTDSCTTKGKNDAEFKGKVENCATCIDKNPACTESQKCSVDCLKVLLN